MQAVVAARGGHPFEDLADFAARIDAAPPQPHADGEPGPGRRVRCARAATAARLFAGADTILRRAQASAEERESGQIALFNGGSAAEPLRLPDVPDWPPMERLGFEAEAIGFHLTAHPLDAYGAALRRLGVVASNQLERRAEAGAARVKLAGTVIGSKERITRTGSRMAWVRLSDSRRLMRGDLFLRSAGAGARRCWRRGRRCWSRPTSAWRARRCGSPRRRWSRSTRPPRRSGAGMRVWLERTEAVEHIRTLLEREGKGRGRVVLIPRLAAREGRGDPLAGGFNVSPRLAQAMKILPGVERIEDI